MKIAVIGTGNMGGAIVRGLIKSGTCKAEEIVCTAKTETTLSRLRAYDENIRTSRNNVEAVREADIVVLAVKPWLAGEVIDEICPALDRQLLVSVAAGITLDDLTKLTGKSQEMALFRVVPNTAVEVLSGVTFIAQRGATEEQVQIVHHLFSSLGYVLTVDEKLIPAGTALASCGIAFAMRYIRAAMEGGVELGFRPEEAAHIVEHTVKGAATMLLVNNTHPEAEIDRVTTAGGITIKGLNAMERAGFTTAVIEGLKASDV